MTKPFILLALGAVLAAACGPATAGAPTGQKVGDKAAGGDQAAVEPKQKQKQQPPPSGEPRDIAFPAIVRNEAATGLEVNTVEWHDLPVVYLRLVIKSGSETDPADQPGLSGLVAAMLEEGTRKRTSAELAEEVEFLGADLWTGSDEENVYVAMRALSEHLDEALDILADVATNPAFRPDELRKLKKRELDRLALQQSDPKFLARREFHQRLYGEHPYAHIDTTPDVVEGVRRQDLVRWHRQWVAPNNSFLVIVGDTTPDQVKTLADAKFDGWRPRELPEQKLAEPPAREERQIVVVDRPDSEQSVIYIGNLAVPRDHEDWIPLQVANQVLGGSAASRLFMDLREQRSLTYGAYSNVGERVRTAPFVASAAVRNEVTGAAVDAFFEHLGRITTDPVPSDELADAQRYLSDSFPLQIDTPGKIAGLVADLRVFGLPDGYWESYRSRIREVEPEGARTAATAHIRPEQALVVVVGRAADVVEPLRGLGAVTVVDPDGKVLAELEPRTQASESG